MSRFTQFDYKGLGLFLSQGEEFNSKVIYNKRVDFYYRYCLGKNVYLDIIKFVRHRVKLFYTIYDKVSNSYIYKEIVILSNNFDVNSLINVAKKENIPSTGMLSYELTLGQIIEHITSGNILVGYISSGFTRNTDYPYQRILLGTFYEYKHTKQFINFLSTNHAELSSVTFLK